jgi:outer membrane protein OmpA-like peptidoglycan-associated protein
VLRVNESIKALVPKTLVPAKKLTVKEKQNLQVKKSQANTINKTKNTALVAKNKSVNEATKTGQIIRAENHAINNGSNKVGFANHREVLGPKGRLAIETIALAASNANHVRLRGFLAREETLAQLGKTHEQFSVGRALSVKNQLIKHGITESKIIILHHKQVRPGAFVEIMFNG